MTTKIRTALSILRAGDLLFPSGLFGEDKGLPRVFPEGKGDMTKTRWRPIQGVR